jgi:hypothetical protein
LNLRLHDYEAKVLTTRTPSSVNLCSIVNI